MNKALVNSLERGNLPRRMSQDLLLRSLTSICEVLNGLIDQDLFPWLQNRYSPDALERDRTAIVVADHLCDAIADPIIRNA